MQTSASANAGLQPAGGVHAEVVNAAPLGHIVQFDMQLGERFVEGRRQFAGARVQFEGVGHFCFAS